MAVIRPSWAFRFTNLSGNVSLIGGTPDTVLTVAFNAIDLPKSENYVMLLADAWALLIGGSSSGDCDGVIDGPTGIAAGPTQFGSVAVPAASYAWLRVAWRGIIEPRQIQDTMEVRFSLNASVAMTARQYTAVYGSPNLATSLTVLYAGF